MAPLAKHSLSFRYLYLRIVIAILRGIAFPLQWYTARKQKIHADANYRRITLPSRDSGRNITVDLYEPKGYQSTKPIPALINMHGSGFTVPSLGTDREFCSLVAARANAVVFDIDYRKAPEHPFPAAIQDVEDVVHHVLAHPDKFAASNVFLSGFSAGGNIALATSSVFGPERIKGVISFYPSVDLTKEHVAPEKHFVSGVTIPPSVRSIYYESYMLPSQPRNDPRISSLFAPTESFPRHVYLTCGNADSLFNPASQFVERLKEAGHSDAVFSEVEYESHGFDKMGKLESVKKKDKVYAEAVDMIIRAIGPRD